MDPARKKALRDAYKAKPEIGGICGIRCSGNGKLYVQKTRDIESLKHRFEFAMSINSYPDPSLRREWAEYGPEAFSFTVLEELKKGETQTSKEFADDLQALYELWLEKNPQAEHQG